MVGIKDMEMPTHCWECDLSYIDNDNEYTLTLCCPCTACHVEEYANACCRPGFCPLVEIEVDGN